MKFLSWFLMLLPVLGAIEAWAQAPALHISLSRKPLLQGNPFAIFISDPNVAGHPAITLTATLDGQAVALVSPENDIWAYSGTPMGSLGLHSFAITISEGGTSVGTQAFSFYVQHNPNNAQIPDISGVSPRVAGIIGGTTIQIAGSNFTGGAVVKMSGNAVSTSFVNSQTLLAVTPSFSATGPVDVEVDLPAVPGISGNPNVIARKALYVATASPGANPVPVAVIANPDQNAATGATVQLDGSGSYDPSGYALRYDWTFQTVPANSALIVGSALANAAMPTFNPDVPGLYVLRLVVRESGVPSPAASSPELAVVQVVAPSLGVFYRPLSQFFGAWSAEF